MVIYDPEAAKAQVLDVMAKMNALKVQLTTALESEALSAEQFEGYLASYEQIPSFEIDWAVAGLKAEDGHELAAELRSQLQQLTGVIGLNKFIAPRFRSDV